MRDCVHFDSSATGEHHRVTITDQVEEEKRITYLRPESRNQLFRVTVTVLVVD